MVFDCCGTCHSSLQTPAFAHHFQITYRPPNTDRHTHPSLKTADTAFRAQLSKLWDFQDNNCWRASKKNPKQNKKKPPTHEAVAADPTLVDDSYVPNRPLCRFDLHSSCHVFFPLFSLAHIIHPLLCLIPFLSTSHFQPLPLFFFAPGTVHCCLTSAFITAPRRPPSTSRLTCESTRPRAGITLKSSKSGHVKLTEVFREPTQVSEGVSWKLAQGQICMSKYTRWFRLETKVGPNLAVNAVDPAWRCRLQPFLPSHHVFPTWSAEAVDGAVDLHSCPVRWHSAPFFAALFVQYCQWGSIFKALLLSQLHLW